MELELIKYHIIENICEKKDIESLLKALDDSICFASVKSDIENSSGDEDD